jgi:hypothetical protein
MIMKLSEKMKSARSEPDVKNNFQDYFGISDVHMGWVDLSAPHIFFEVKQFKTDIYKMLAQLILTIHKHQTEFDSLPEYIGAFDNEKCGIVEFDKLWQRIETYSDINWNQTPSMVDDKTIALVKKFINELPLESGLRVYNFSVDEAELKSVLNKITKGKAPNGRVLQKAVDINNFVTIFQKYVAEIGDNIDIDFRDVRGFAFSDFYLADLISEKNFTIKRYEKLKVIRSGNVYRVNFGHKFGDTIDGLEHFGEIKIKDKKKHDQFWEKYKRPPNEKYWAKILERSDLLVPQHAREIKGAFFTPQEWVEKSHEYMAQAFGDDFSDMYIWDCAAGTGNLLVGLPQDKRNMFASTLDDSDVRVMRADARESGNMFTNHIFQFDFLNDPMAPNCDGGKVPDRLYEILSDKNERKKLIIYINPPYAEGDTHLHNKNKRSFTANRSEIYERYFPRIGKAANELFALFVARIAGNFNGTMLGLFSTPKLVSGPNFAKFRDYFNAKYLGGFVVPAKTFDNVKGKFPISFTMWDMLQKTPIGNITCDVFNKKAEFMGTKKFYSYSEDSRLINDWQNEWRDNKEKPIAMLSYVGNDFQNQNFVFISHGRGHHETGITKNNLMQSTIYFAVRHVIEDDWLNDGDQFLYPISKDIEGNKTNLLDYKQEFLYESDKIFQDNCLIFTMFNSKNRISSSVSVPVESGKRKKKIEYQKVSVVNHWIPFTERQVGSTRAFESNFMSNFLDSRNLPEALTPVARAVYNSGLALWQYYFSKNPDNQNASFYDIKEYFKGRKPDGKMNNKSDDVEFTRLESVLASAVRELAAEIEPKIYEYGFLKK